MTIEEIRKNAPDGATHYSMSARVYLKDEKKKEYIFKFGKWILLHSKIPKDATPIGQPNVKH